MDMGSDRARGIASEPQQTAHGAQFVEVKVDPELCTVKVTRVVEVTACGKIINPLAPPSQEIGGVVWGIGMALEGATAS